MTTPESGRPPVGFFVGDGKGVGVGDGAGVGEGEGDGFCAGEGEGGGDTGDEVGDKEGSVPVGSMTLGVCVGGAKEAQPAGAITQTAAAKASNRKRA